MKKHKKKVKKEVKKKAKKEEKKKKKKQVKKEKKKKKKIHKSRLYQTIFLQSTPSVKTDKKDFKIRNTNKGRFPLILFAS
ncbi:hypothetical protein Vi05172_g1736 [Venturia inaequalis]|nr:hypothetical protein Vi05172_g1736 [Venturia inaequalis]